MKLLLFSLLALCVGSMPLMAQSKAEKAFGKLADKVNNKSYSSKHLKAAAADSASTVLDGKEVRKDSEGLSGIYYFTHPILVKNSGGKTVVVKKVLLDYLENDDKGKGIYVVYLKAAASFEDPNSSKYIKPATFFPGSTPRETNIKVGKKTGHMFFDDRIYENRLWTYFAPEGSHTNFGSGIRELEKGIFIMDYSSPENESQIPEFLKKHHYVVFFRADKAAAAHALTQEEICKRLIAIDKKIEVANKDGSTGFNLPKPGGGKTELFDKAREATTKILQDHINKQGKGSTNHSLLYIYTLTPTPYWKDIVDKRMVNGTQKEVKIGRYTEYYAVLQNNAPEPYKGIWQFNNKYSYIIVQVAEKMKGDAHSINEFTGTYYIHAISQPFFLSEEENATIMRFKGQ